MPGPIGASVCMHLILKARIGSGSGSLCVVCLSVCLSGLGGDGSGEGCGLVGRWMGGSTTAPHTCVVTGDEFSHVFVSDTAQGQAGAHHLAPEQGTKFGHHAAQMPGTGYVHMLG